MGATTTQTLREQTDEAAERAARRISDAADAAGAAVRGASHKVTAAVGDIGDRASAATHDLTRRVEQQPLTSVLVAAGAGFVVGLLMGRR
jgi:ElaB/YqjD/DUF883 family membrane-anchored ribosome-binding protein